MRHARAAHVALLALSLAVGATADLPGTVVGGAGPIDLELYILRLRHQAR